MKIPLSAWGVKHYSPAPSIRTLRAWAASGQIVPEPERVGRLIMVDENAARMPVECVMNERKIADLPAWAKAVLQTT